MFVFKYRYFGNSKLGVVSTPIKTALFSANIPHVSQESQKFKRFGLIIGLHCRKCDPPVNQLWKKTCFSENSPSYL
jgi:hypothetical protein